MMRPWWIFFNCCLAVCMTQAMHDRRHGIDQQPTPMAGMVLTCEMTLMAAAAATGALVVGIAIDLAIDAIGRGASRAINWFFEWAHSDIGEQE